MKESDEVAEVWIYYDEFINTIHSETMMNNSPGPGIQFLDDFPGPLDLNQLEKLFPPAPPFPPALGECSELTNIQLSCPHTSQFKVN